MNFKVGDVICQYEASFGLFDYETSLSEIAFCITKIEKENVQNKNPKVLLEFYKFYVVIIKFRDLSEDKKNFLLKHLPETVDLNNLPISTYVHCKYYIEDGSCQLYKDDAHLNEYPSGIEFKLIKFHDRLKINGKFVFEGYNRKSVKNIKNAEKVFNNSSHQNNQFTEESLIIPNKYIIIYDGNDQEEITLYGPDKDNNYTTEPPPTLLDKMVKCVGKFCSSRIHPNRGGSKTRKRRKFKKTYK